MQEGTARHAIKLDWSDFDTALPRQAWELGGLKSLTRLLDR
jgi:hypothetical protein